MKRLATLLCAWLLALASVASPAYASVTTTGAGKVPASGGSFNPSSTNPLVWIDPRTGVTCTVAPCNGTNTTLSAIANQGSLGTSLTPGVATAGSYIASAKNSLPAIRTIGSEYLIGSTNAVFAGASTLVVVVVAKMNTFLTGGNNTVFTLGPAGLGSGWGAALPNATTGIMVSGDVYGYGNGFTPGSTNAPQINVSSGGASADTTNYHIYGLILSATGGNQRIEVDGVNQTPLSNNQNGVALAAATAPINIGVDPGSANYDVSVLQAFAVNDNSTPLTTLHNLEQWAGCTYQLNYNGSVPACP